MEKYKELKEKLSDELARYNTRELTVANLDTLNKIAHTLKCIVKIEESEDCCEEEPQKERNTVLEALYAMWDCASSEKERNDIKKAIDSFEK